jgi:hypothetical protein
VIAAVRAGRFAIYTVRSVDEAIELLTGVPAEPSDPLERAPSVNRAVARRLDQLWTLRATLPRREGEARPRRRRRRDGD